jgi:WD40 repeat protein
MAGVFLSYARVDGEHCAAEIRHRLAQTRDIEITQDRLFLEGGLGWWKQVTEAIDSVEFLVLVVTSGALESSNVEREWRYARQQGVCVYPIKGAADAAIPFAKMPRWMMKAHLYDLDREWSTFLGHLRKGCDQPRVPFMAPDLPPYFVERPEKFAELKKLLLSGESGPLAITTALEGAGGFGKTTLAAALCHDRDVIDNFFDGILWITLGHTPDVLGSLVTAYAALTGDRPGFSGVEDAAFQLGGKLAERTCLLVIDDVWDAEHLHPFLRGAKSSARLFTTRNSTIASFLARAVEVDQMRAREATAMLGKGVADLESGQARDLAERLGEWPLALELAAAMMRERVRQGDSAANAAERLLRLIERRGPGALADPTRRDRTIRSVLKVSLELLEEDDRERLYELGIFPEDAAVPLSAAATLWGLEEFAAEDLAQRLARLSLIKLDLGRAILRLHDVMGRWLAGNLPDARAIHNRLVNAWPEWRDLPDKYAWRWLPWHLTQAGRKPEVTTILWDPRWMRAKLKTTDVNALIADYDLLRPAPEAELLQGALRLSAHLLAIYEGQFASQITGRLLQYQDAPEIRKFIDEVAGTQSEPWFRPVDGALHPPGTELLRTLDGHSASVWGVAVTPDGKRAVSASADDTLIVWDLESGRAIETLQGHSDSVIAVAVTTDGRAISASYDDTLRMWDLESGRTLRVLKGHSNSVWSVAVTADGKLAISASEDNTLNVWDLDRTGCILYTLEGHARTVRGVTFTPDGKRAVSASFDDTLKVWDIETGYVLRTLEGHSDFVNCVAVTPDGQRAISASSDKTLKIWDLETGRILRTLEGHEGKVWGVAIAADGKRVVSASNDKTLMLWDTESGHALRALEGHSGAVNSVALTPDGNRAVSASSDRTLKVWDLESGRAFHARDGHKNLVTGVGVTADGNWVVSASRDRTLKVWDLRRGEVVRTLEGHTNAVCGVAVIPCTHRAVSASEDHTLKVWSLNGSRALSTLKGHTDCVRAVAVTRNGRRAISASDDHTLKVWNLLNGSVVRTLRGHTDSVRGVAVTPDGRAAISASADKTLKVWDLETGRVLHNLQGHAASVAGVAVTADGGLVVSASDDQTLKLWELKSGLAVRTLEGHLDGVSGVTLLTKQRAVSASWDKTLRAWGLTNGNVIATFGCDAAPGCCAFLDERSIVVGDAAGCVYSLSIEEP